MIICRHSELNQLLSSQKLTEKEKIARIEVVLSEGDHE